jgi:hypothetical protein
VFGCLRRFVSLIVLAVIGVAAFATRASWLPLVRKQLAETTPPAEQRVADSLKAVADTAGWVTIGTSDATRGKAAVAKFKSARGPSLLNLDAAEFAGAMLDSVSSQLPTSAQDLKVRVQGNELQLRAYVRLGDLGGSAVLGPLASMVGEREPLTLGGILEPTSITGVSQFKLTSVRIGAFAVPSAVIPRLMKALKRDAGTVGVEVSALPVRLPPGVGDVRVNQGKVTLYRAAQ